VVFCDPFTPVIPFVLPANTSHGISLGSLLTAPAITQKQILNACIPVKESQYISVLGYQSGENLLKYPKILREKVVDCLVSLRHLADYIILDCASVFEADITSLTAIETADIILYLASANLKGVSYYQSHAMMLADQRFHLQKRLMAIGNQKVGQDWETAGELYGGVQAVFPYITEMEQQENELSLFHQLTDPNSCTYQQALNQILKEAFSLEKENDGMTAKRIKNKRSETKENQMKEKKSFQSMFRRKGEF